MMTIEITLPLLHNGQEAMLSAAKRFNVVRCGRRWGKTVLGTDLVVNPAIEGEPVALLTPSYADSDELWEEIVDILEPMIHKKNESKRRILLTGGGKIHFYSFENINRMRGKKYKRAVVDEAAFCKNLLDGWQKVIRPTLTDLRGDAWFFSTPIMDSDFQKLDEYSATRKSWASFHAPSSSNPALSPAELAEIEADLPADVFDQEYKALYVNFNGKNFVQYWNRDTNITQANLYDKGEDIYFAFDFNIANTILVIQAGEGWLNVLREYHGDLIDLEGLCKIATAEWGDCQGVVYINGDASGNASSALTKDNSSAYQLIRKYMGLDFGTNFRVPTVNPGHLSSYIHCNAFFKRCNWKVHSSCELTILDIEKVRVLSEKGKFEIDKSDLKLGHRLDCLRYHINAEHRYILTNIEDE